MLGSLGVRALADALALRLLRRRADRATIWLLHAVPEATLVRADADRRALADLRAGRFVILAEGEPGESQLCMAAELVTPEAVNFMATHGRGLVCLA